MFIPLQTSVKMKLLCAQVIKDILGDSIDVRPLSLSLLHTSLRLLPLNLIISLPLPHLNLLCFFFFHLLSYIFPSATLSLIPSYVWLTHPFPILSPTPYYNILPAPLLYTLYHCPDIQTENEKNLQQRHQSLAVLWLRVCQA